MQSPWPSSDDDTLRRMAADGATALQAAAALGRSRNAVLGRAFRINVQFGLSTRSVGHRQPAARINKYKHPTPALVRDVARSEPAPFVPVAMPEPALIAGPVGLEQLAPRHCRYIAGDPGEGGAIYCGERRAPGSPYCAAHHALCYVARAPGRSVVQSRFAP